jgi:hypothetical protein
VVLLLVCRVVVVVLLLLCSGVVLSQEGLDTCRSWQPLSEALNGLEAEISYDAKALSKYRVWVPERFQSVGEAIDYLLKDKPLRVEKVGDVFVIVPVKKDPQGFENLHEAWGEFNMPVAEILLRETVVTAPARPQGKGMRYEITAGLSRGASNALELLGAIPGVYYDKLSEEIRVNHQRNILVLVDGIAHSLHYLRHLSANRVRCVEVVRSMSGRFVSDDYDAIIQVTLKKDYKGLDINFSNKNALNLSGSARGLTENVTDAGVISSGGKINVFGTYSYKREKWKLYTTKALSYNSCEYISFAEEKPNDISGYASHTVTGGISYPLSVVQEMSAHVEYSGGKGVGRQEYRMRPSDNVGNDSRMLVNTTERGRKYDMVTSAVSYKGQLHPRLQLYANFCYNYYYNDVINHYNQNYSRNYRSENEYNEYKNYTVFDVEGESTLSPVLSLESGYSNIWREYGSESSIGRGFLDYEEYRNKVYLYVSYYPPGSWRMKCGLAVEDIKTGVNENVRLLPYAQLIYKHKKALKAEAGYSSGQSYPSLYQLSPMSQVIDTFLTQIGNPGLKSSLRHQFFIDLTLWDKLKIMPQFVYQKDGISELYARKEYKLFRQFGNMDIREYRLEASWEQVLHDCIQLKNRVLFYYDEAHREGFKHGLGGWLCASEVNYDNESACLGVQLGYYRNMRKKILWQGYEMDQRDYYCVSVRKALWNNRLSVMLSYIPPLGWGIRGEQIKEVETPLYGEKSITDMTTQKQMLLLRVNIRLEESKVRR